MKWLVRQLGVVIFWLLWPVWWVYFKLSPSRARVLVVCGNEVLLLWSWLGQREWSLPGGGLHRQETAKAAALRELYEETGINVPNTSLSRLGQNLNHRHGLTYEAEYFILVVPGKPNLRLGKFEVIDAKWFSLEFVRSLPLTEDTRYAIDVYLGRDPA